MFGKHINLQQESLSVTLCDIGGIVSAFPWCGSCCHCSIAKASLESKADTLWF